ncbi:alpha/beta hydrolase [Diaphorobacter sp. HDW4A]|uniref:alpha/beta hydrolase n=1 Tax=Diaphorobacter sp. HDW4A TaxID=2714924 RepID=UPI00140844D4|nr:alpha/beta hydrolase [Diaphorobacter sp. HDW4A]QIL79967.1 alpha/beta hydrolase [Diaphorobacter sp. HDW4A]
MTATTDTLHEVTTHDIDYLVHPGITLQVRIHQPEGPGPFPLIAEVHGGAWCRGDRLDEDRFNYSLAQRGIVVAAIDFRMPPDAAYPASMQDINYAIRWLKANAKKWRSSANRVGIMGLSSGAHQAILGAMRPKDARYSALPLANENQDASVNCAVLCWPVIDPLGRYRYACDLQRAGGDYPPTIDRVIPDHLKYWGNEEAMSEGSPALALERGEAARLPPVLYLQGDKDIVHPRAHLERFVTAYREAGGDVTLNWYPGEVEGFVKTRPDSPSTAKAVNDVVQFVVTQCCA